MGSSVVELSDLIENKLQKKIYWITSLLFIINLIEVN